MEEVSNRKVLTPRMRPVFVSLSCATIILATWSGFNGPSAVAPFLTISLAVAIAFSYSDLFLRQDNYQLRTFVTRYWAACKSRGFALGMSFALIISSLAANQYISAYALSLSVGVWLLFESLIVDWPLEESGGNVRTPRPN